ncbi:hypothetical protein NLI96_g3713 [Meripilus lineatus]|uniref:Cytochrome P450 n=1 Tax=Meripilus lineatus TaxID=2056292 RepID=A0AAD5VBP2_9APHY|nr:hypothetical protein NLI96_g3713 [Physisporinus lineatus]
MNNPSVNETISSVVWVGVGLLLVQILRILTEKLIPGFKRPLPPGPSPKELSPEIPTFLQYHQFSQKYSPVFSLKIGRELFVVIAGYKEVLEIMQKRSVDLTDRPRCVSGVIISGDLRVLFVNSGDRLKRLRRALHAQLQPSAAKEYQPLQFRHAKQYILDIVRDPEHHMDHARRYSASVVLSMVYGKKTPTRYSDPEVIEIEKTLKRVVECLHPGTYLVDSFPFLKYFPTPEMRKLQRYQKEELDLFKRQLGVVRRQIANKEDIPPSFSTYLLERQQEYQLSDDEIAYLTGEIFGAGTDTTASAIAFVTMAAACFPHEQAKVQAQLDAVVGKTRLPTFEDQAELPSGVPHRASKDIIWNDYVIPAGATVVGNHWSILRDPEAFPDPESFKPERWLTEGGQIRDDLKMFGFGFGRRACPGQPVADRSVFINTALLLWSFNISEDPSAPIDTMNFKLGITVDIHPFKLIFNPRVEDLKQHLTSDFT